MKVHTEILQIETKGKGTYDLTQRLRNVLSTSDIKAGTVTVFVRHTSASLVIYENADAPARDDLHEFFERLVPENTAWFTHTYEGPDDMPSHLRMALTRTSEVIPVDRGQLMLGTWQGVFLFEHRKIPHQREIVVTVMGI